VFDICRSDKYLSFVEDYLPSSWQPISHAYFWRPEYQLFKLAPDTLEFNSLNSQLTKCGLHITRVSTILLNFIEKGSN
jgi:hypothetical protein